MKDRTFFLDLNKNLHPINFIKKSLLVTNKQTYFLKKSNLILLKKLKTKDKPYKRVNKNFSKIALNQMVFQYFGGIDLMEIEGVSHATVLTIVSGIGPNRFYEFP